MVGAVIGGVGLLIGAAAGSPGFGFLGGIFYFRLGLPGGTYATTFSTVVNVWRGNTNDNLGSQSLIDHELYHTRQYMYFQDWLGASYFTVCALWGLISTGVSSQPFSPARAFNAVGEVGNPIEVPAYKVSW